MDQLDTRPVRGTNDVVPPDRALHLAVEARIRAGFDLFGYDPIDTPVLEPTDLFLKKSGEEIVARMYSFTHWNRELCLRPEFTASVIRAYIRQLQDRPLPVRLQYSGPTFRYEKPQRGRHRQFTEIGIECIGAGGPAADAEVLAVARQGLEQLGLGDARFVIGHLGAVLELLGQLGMDARAQSLVLGAMEHLSRAPGEEERVMARLASILGYDEESTEPRGEALAELMRSFGPDGAARIAQDLLEGANLSLEGGGRAPAEIIERLLAKSYRPDPRPALKRAIEFIVRLRDASGPPQEALPALRRLLNEYGLHDGPVGEVEQAIRLFDAHYADPAQVHVNLSLARGLRYYTGLVFEVYDGEGNQLAGGGRYDDLVRSLGGHRAVPACGFSYGLERIVAAHQRRHNAKAIEVSRVLVAPISEADYAVAAGLAMRVRGAGLVAEIDPRFRGLKSALRHADRRGMPLVVIVGESERADGVVTLRDMRQFEETRVPVAELIDALKRRLEPDVPSSTGEAK